MRRSLVPILLGPTYTPEAQVAFAAMTAPPSLPLKRLYDAYIRALKTAGVWAKRDAIYLLNVETAQAARVNIKSPGTYDLTATSSPTFTAKVGYAGDGAAAYLDTNLNPATATTPNFVRNSANVSAAGVTTTAGNPIMGIVSGGTVKINPRLTADNMPYGEVNSATDFAGSAVVDASGHHSANRSGANASQLYKNGASIATDAAASVAVSSANISLLRFGGAFYGGTIAMAAIGGSLSAQEVADDYAAWLAFRNGVAQL